MSQIAPGEAKETDYQNANIDLKRTRERLDSYIERGIVHTYVNLAFNILYHTFFAVSWIFRLLFYFS